MAMNEVMKNVKFGFYSRKYNRHFKDFKAFQGFDYYQKKMWVLNRDLMFKHPKKGNKRYINKKLYGQLAEYKEKREPSGNFNMKRD